MRFTDSNEIIEEARLCATEGAEQKEDRNTEVEDYDFPEHRLVCECNDVRQHHMCIVQQ